MKLHLNTLKQAIVLTNALSINKYADDNTPLWALANALSSLGHKEAKEILSRLNKLIDFYEKNPEFLIDGNELAPTTINALQEEGYVFYED